MVNFLYMFKKWWQYALKPCSISFISLFHFPQVSTCNLWFLVPVLPDGYHRELLTSPFVRERKLGHQEEIFLQDIGTVIICVNLSCKNQENFHFDIVWHLFGKVEMSVGGLVLRPRESSIGCKLVTHCTTEWISLLKRP